MRGAASARAGRVVLACLCVALGVTGAVAVADGAGATASSAPPAVASPSATPTPTWKLKSFRKVGGDRSFKAQLIDELPAPPELLVIGGSRAARFEPSYFTGLTGLQSVNCAVQNCRPEDLYAFASHLYRRAPETRLRCFFAVQAPPSETPSSTPGCSTTTAWPGGSRPT